MFTFSLLTRGLIDEYGWRGTVLLLAGICFQGSVFGLLLLPPDNGSVADTKPTQDEQLPMMIETSNSEKNKNDEIENDIILEAETSKAGESFIEKDCFKENNSVKDPKAVVASKRNRLNLLLGSFRKLFDFTLLTNVKFLIFILSIISVHLAYPLVINMTVDRSVELGMTKYEASWMTSAIGKSASVYYFTYYLVRSDI